MIYAQYGRPVCVRFENRLEENPYGLDRGTFGAPDWSFLTHLHNGHTAPESDGNPHHRPESYRPGEYCDNLYLNWAAGADDCEKQSFFWFHDHRMDHTGSNVYKGMVGLYPIYDPDKDPGDERLGLHLPGLPNAETGRIDYDIPLAIFDCRLDDGVTPHQDFHNPGLGPQPRNWGKTFFAHYPNQGFVGDVFTVNGKAYPVLRVKRRKYRLRFLDASIARIYQFKLMSGKVVADPGSLGQFNLKGAQQVMKFTQIAAEGGLLCEPIVRDSFDLWPAKRREFIVDFSKYMDGSPTRKGEAIYLTNILPMSDGRKADSPDPDYRVPVLKIVIDGDPPEQDRSEIPVFMRDMPPCPPLSELRRLPQHRFELERGGSFGGETQWLIKVDDGEALPFDHMYSAVNVPQGSEQVWTFANGGGGWVHPFHIHEEEHRVIMRDGKLAPDSAHPDDESREDVVALGPGEEVMIYRRFRGFRGRYVAHCHNLAHEDHAMMFGWTIV
jgi:FtsP/CotA-like multicopper oxidase with cupredoxin domain